MKNPYMEVVKSYMEVVKHCHLILILKEKEILVFPFYIYSYKGFR